MNPFSRSLLPLALAAAFVVAACKKEAPPKVGTGDPIASGVASDLRLSPDGERAAFLMDARRPPLDGIPPQVQLGHLHLGRVDDKQARPVGEKVVNSPGGYLFSGDSKWLLFLNGYDVQQHRGELMVVDAGDPGAVPRSLAKDVSYYVTSPDSRWVAYVDGGALRVAPLAGGAAADVAASARTVEFAPDSSFLLVKRTLDAGGGLWLAKSGEWSKLQLLGEQAGDYIVSPDSKHVAFSQRSVDVPGTYDLAHLDVAKGTVRRIGTGVTTGAPFHGASFAFSPDGKYLARIQGGRPEKRGELVVGPANGSGGRSVAKEVYRFAFSPDSSAVAFLDRYADNKGPGAGHGFVGMATLPDGAPKQVGERSPNFEWAADGKHLAFVSRFFKPIYSVDLMLYPVGAEAARKVGQGVYGYDFSASNGYLLMRTRCIRDGRACELHALDLGKPDAQPVKVMDGVYSFRSAPKDPKRILATYARVDNNLFDAMAVNLGTNEFKTLDRGIQLPPMFADPDGSKVVYVVGDRGRAGVYVTTAMP